VDGWTIKGKDRGPDLRRVPASAGLAETQKLGSPPSGWDADGSLGAASDKCLRSRRLANLARDH